ncbi:hypothetical protein BGX38DRAFT_1259791 [Terfezia claveryi]|nr:hypothetical protein BGX38DRAFT_1259791 [Terfezia claveryi]
MAAHVFQNGRRIKDLPGFMGLGHCIFFHPLLGTHGFYYQSTIIFFLDFNENPFLVIRKLFSDMALDDHEAYRDSNSETLLNIFASKLQETGESRVNEDDLFGALGGVYEMCQRGYPISKQVVRQLNYSPDLLETLESHTVLPSSRTDIQRDEFTYIVISILKYFGTEASVSPISSHIQRAAAPAIIFNDRVPSILLPNGIFFGSIVDIQSGSLPNPTLFTTTKISGLAVNTEYTFHIPVVLKTSAGTYSSDQVMVKTQKLTDLSGITVCPGVMPPEAKEQLETTLLRIGRGQAWERAVEMNIPVVRPEWVEACESEGGIVGVRAYYLTADPRLMRPPLRERGPRPGTASLAGSTPAQTPDLRQNSPSPERKELPLQPPKEGIPENLDEVAAAATQANSHTEEWAAVSNDEGDEERDEKQKEKEITPAKPEFGLGDVASPDSSKKTEEGFETVSL